MKTSARNRISNCFLLCLGWDIHPLKHGYREGLEEHTTNKRMQLVNNGYTSINNLIFEGDNMAAK